MPRSLTTFQSALTGEDTCPIDPNSAGFQFTAKVRRPWCEGRTMITARSVLTLVPDAERRRLVAEYADEGGGLAMFGPAAKATFLEFLVPRLPDPSHALSLCLMDQALTRAGSGGEAPKRRAIRDRIEREAWECIERAVRRSNEIDGWDRIERGVWECVEADVSACIGHDVWGDIERDARTRIECEAWQFIGSSGRARTGRGPHASLVWFHADPAAVFRALRGAPPPPLGERAYPVLFAPGLPNLYRAATVEEAALWERLPADDGRPELIERLLAEEIVTSLE